MTTSEGDAKVQDYVDGGGLRTCFEARGSGEPHRTCFRRCSGDLHAAVSPDGPEHWDVVVDKVWQMIGTEPNFALTELEKVSAHTLVVAADH